MHSAASGHSVEAIYIFEVLVELPELDGELVAVPADYDLDVLFHGLEGDFACQAY